MNPTSYGLLKRDGLLLALPLSVLREVLPLPEHLDPLPHDVPGVVGAHVLRGRVIPVVDLSAILSGTREPDQPQVLAVLRHGSSVLAVIADSAEGIVTVDAGTHTQMARGRQTVASVVFTHPGLEGVVSVLEVDNLFARFAEVAITVDPGTDMAAVHGDGSRSAHLGAAHGSELPVLMATCDDLGLGIPIRSVDGMQTTSSIRPSTLQGGACLGVIEYRGNEVPLVDPLALLSLGHTTVQAVNECLVLSLDGGFVALLISSVVRLQHVEPSALQGLPAFGISRREAFDGLWDGGQGGRFLLVSDGALTTDPELNALARMNNPVGARSLGAGSSGSVVTRSGAGDDPTADVDLVEESRTYITFTAGLDLATPVEAVDAIVNSPSDRVVYDSDIGWVGGLFAYRDAMIPLVDLTALLGQAPGDGGSAVVLVMRSEAGHVGFLIERLLSIEASSARIRGGTSSSDGLPGIPLDLDAMAFAVFGSAKELVPIIDLQGLCAHLTGGLLAV